MNNVTAVYENGVLKPSVPLELAEGQTVRLNIVVPIWPLPVRQRTPEEEDFDRRIKEAKSLKEMTAIIDSLPLQDKEYDIVRAINETRRLTGFRVPDPGY